MAPKPTGADRYSAVPVRPFHENKQRFIDARQWNAYPQSNRAQNGLHTRMGITTFPSLGS